VLIGDGFSNMNDAAGYRVAPLHGSIAGGSSYTIMKTIATTGYVGCTTKVLGLIHLRVMYSFNQQQHQLPAT
jgi:hypothetical protein